MEDKKKDQGPEIGDEELDQVAGGNDPVILGPEYDDYWLFNESCGIQTVKACPLTSFHRENS